MSLYVLYIYIGYVFHLTFEFSYAITAHRLTLKTIQPVRDGVIRFFKINGINAFQIRKLQNMNRLVFLGLNLFKIVVRERDILALFVFAALHQLVV